MKKQKITANGRTIGTVLGDVFTKRVSPGKHQLRMFPAYGLSVEALFDLMGLEVKTIKIIEKGGNTLKSSLDDWLAPDIKKMTLGGHDLQAFLPIDRMEICKPKSPKKKLPLK